MVWLWEELAALAPPQKRAFLRYATGSDRVPLGGLGRLTIVVRRDGADSSRQVQTAFKHGQTWLNTIEHGLTRFTIGCWAYE